MAIGFERNDASRRVVITVQGAFELADILAVIERQRVEHARSYGLLYDLRGMTGSPNIDDLRQVLSEGTQSRPDEPLRGPIALLVTNPVLYGVACTYAALGRSKLTVEVFRDWDEADRWLAAHTSP